MWFYIFRLFFHFKIVLRFGGSPVSVRASAQRNMLSIRNISQWFRSRLGVTGTHIMLKKCDGVIAVSEHLADEIRPLVGKKTIVCVAPPILTINRPQNRAHTYVPGLSRVLTVANLNYREKCEGVVHIVSSLADYCRCHTQDTEVVYDVVGSGTHFSWIKEGIDRIEIPKNLLINLHGQQNDVARYFKKSDVFLYCSTLDSYGLVLAEASAHGVPIIVNRWGPFPEMFPGVYDACFFDFGSPNSLVEQLEKVLPDNALKKRMRQASLANYKRSNNIKKCGMLLKEFFSELI